MSAPANRPMPDVRLRPGAVADLDALIELETKAFTYDVATRREFRQFLASPRAVLLVAEHGGRVAGYVLVLFRARSRIARLYSIVVAGHSAGRGIGPLLLAAAEAAAVARGATALRLEVHETNAAAISRYRKTGYALFGRHPDYYDDGGSALRFEKRFPQHPAGGGQTASPRGRPAR